MKPLIIETSSVIDEERDNKMSLYIKSDVEKQIKRNKNINKKKMDELKHMEGDHPYLRETNSYLHSPI
jgi:hypothetical protein